MSGTGVVQLLVAQMFAQHERAHPDCEATDDLWIEVTGGVVRGYCREWAWTRTSVAA